jgi:hypothetical protein
LPGSFANEIAPSAPTRKTAADAIERFGQRFLFCLALIEQASDRDRALQMRHQNSQTPAGLVIFKSERSVHANVNQR